MKCVISLAAITALSLSACSAADDQAEAGAPAETSMLAPSAKSTLAPGSISLSSEAVTVNGPEGTTLAMGSPRQAVETELASALGEAIRSDSNEECGAGPMQFTYYANGLTVNFIDAKLVGWFVDSDGAQGGIATAENITIGSPIADVTRVYTLEDTSDSTLGDEFYTDEGIGGFFEGADDERTVATLYSGTNCFFR